MEMLEIEPRSLGKRPSAAGIPQSSAGRELQLAMVMMLV
jgi:hypothetical protein